MNSFQFNRLFSMVCCLALGVVDLAAQEECGWNPDANNDNTIGVYDLLALLGIFQENDADDDGIWDSVDDCVGAYDPCGECNGEGTDNDADGICDADDDCVGAYDECGVCNGPGPTVPVIESIEVFYDSIYVEQIDFWYVFEIGADTTFSYECPPPACPNEVVSFATIPELTSDTLQISAGSTVLFRNETNPQMLAGGTSFNWDFGNGETSATAGPHGITYDTPGSYLVTFGVVTFNGQSDLGETCMVIEVTEAPDFIPTLSSANTCTTIGNFNGYQSFQTQSEDACSCPNANMGPAISFPDVGSYPDGTVSTIYWGGPGNPPNGGNAESTSFVWPQPASNSIDGALVVFQGQLTILGHYSGSGSYNLVYVVEFPDGCTFSTYAIMSWGAGVINFCQNTTLSACDPFIHELCFDGQYPGNTYTIDWGDGSEEEVYEFPNLPTAPNRIPHQFPASCTGEDDETESYLITVTALNLCLEDTTTNTQGPFEVSMPPQAVIGYDSGLEIVQGGSIVFSDLSFAGYEASNGTCSEDYDWQWSINGSNNLNGFGYEVTSGSLGSEQQFLNGTHEIEVTFHEPGTYQIGLKVYNAYCTDDVMYLTVTVLE